MLLHRPLMKQSGRQNADEIAAFLSSANPNWRTQDVKDLMHMHLSTTKTELVARYSKDYTADVQAWDAVYGHILTMSDVISGGIIKQYPEKFAGPKMYSQKEIDLDNAMRPGSGPITRSGHGCTSSNR